MKLRTEIYILVVLIWPDLDFEQIFHTPFLSDVFPYTEPSLRDRLHGFEFRSY